MRRCPVLLLAIALAGCGAPSESTFAHVGGEIKGAPAAGQAGTIARKVIQTATLELVVEDIDPMAAEVERLTAALGGLVEKSEVNTSPYRIRTHTWKLRIPEAKFADALKQFESLGTPVKSSRDAVDVTNEYIDVEARIDNLLKQEEALNRLLSTTESEETILKIQEGVRKVRTELDSATGRRKFLDQSVALATLDLTVRESRLREEPAALRPGFAERATRTFTSSLEGLGDFFVALALIGVALVPWLPVILVTLLSVRFFLRRVLNWVGRQLAWALSPAKPRSGVGPDANRPGQPPPGGLS